MTLLSLRTYLLPILLILVGLGCIAYGSFGYFTRAPGEIKHSQFSIDSNIDTTTASIDLNTASREALLALPRIGEVTADKIIVGRPYTRSTDLRDRKIVTAKVFAVIEEFLRVP